MSSEREAQVRRRAYDIWEKEGRPHGRDKAHWHQAERDLATERTSPEETPSTSEAEATPDAPQKAARRAGEPKVATNRAAKTRNSKTAKPAEPAVASEKRTATRKRKNSASP